MAKYTLNVLFEKPAMDTIYQVNEKVTIVKQTNGDQDVAWVSFLPFEKNTVSWKNEYALYCSASELKAGATIDKLTDEMAFDGLLYDFSKATFNNPRTDNSVEPNTYGVWNLMEGYQSLIFGLAQNVQVNNSAYPNSPINAQSVPYDQFVRFEPYERIEVFMESQVDNGMVISTIRSKSIFVEYSGNVTSQTIKYNTMTNSFYFA